MSWEDMARSREKARIGSKRLRNAILKSLGYTVARPELRRPRARKPLLVNSQIIAVQRAVARHYGITHAELIEYNRGRAYSHPRQVAMYLARLGGASFPEIGRHFSRDHTTVLHAWRTVPHNPDLWIAAIDIHKLLGRRAVETGDNSQIMSKSLVEYGKEQSANGQEKAAA